MIIKFVIGFWQILINRIVIVTLRCFGGSFSVTRATKINPHSRYLFISNHQSILDPFIIFGALPFTHNLAAAPTRFMTARTVYYTIWRPLIFLVGCYPTYIKGTTAVQRTIEYLSSGYNVFIFPEGRRTNQHNSAPKDGVAQIIQRAQEQSLVYEIVLIRIKWKNASYWKRHATLSFSTISSADCRDASATEIMARIYKL